MCQLTWVTRCETGLQGVNKKWQRREHGTITKCRLCLLSVPIFQSEATTGHGTEHDSFNKMAKGLPLRHRAVLGEVEAAEEEIQGSGRWSLSQQTWSEL